MSHAQATETGTRGGRGPACQRGMRVVGLLVLAAVVALVIAGSGDARDTQPKQPPTPPAKQKPPAHKTKKKTTGVPKGKKRAPVKKAHAPKDNSAGKPDRPSPKANPWTTTQAKLSWDGSNRVDRYAVFPSLPNDPTSYNPNNPMTVLDNSKHKHKKFIYIINGLPPSKRSFVFVVAYKDKNDMTGTPSNKVPVRAKIAPSKSPSPSGPDPAKIAEGFFGKDAADLENSGALPEMTPGVDPKHCCANFVSACLERAGLIDHSLHSNVVYKRIDGQPPPLADNLRKAGWQKVDFTNAKPGDVVIITGKDENGASESHTELVESNDNGRLKLIGSNNTNSDLTQKVGHDTTDYRASHWGAYVLTPPRR